VRRILKAAPLVVMFLLLNTRAARAACSFNPPPDPTVDGSTNSLRHAIQMANANSEDCLIQLQAGTYTLTIQNNSGQDNTAAEGDLDITHRGLTVTIQGKGAGLSIVNGKGIDRVFQVLGGANAMFRKLTIEGGVARDDGTSGALPGTTESEGGGLLVQDHGHVTLSQVWVEGNQAIGGNRANGTNATVSDGPAGPGTPGKAAAGGGLFLSAGTVDLTDSKMSGNATKGGYGGAGGYFNATGGAGGGGGPSGGGGLYLLSGGARLFRSTVSGNAAEAGPGGRDGGAGSEGCSGNQPGIGGAGGQGAGGGLFVLSGSVGLFSSTVSRNHATGGLGGTGGFSGPCGIPGRNGGVGQGAGLFLGRGALHMEQTTVSGNTATGGTGGFAGGINLLFRPSPSGGSSQGAGMLVASGKISLANSTLFANKAKGGSGGCTSSDFCGHGGDAAGGGLYIISGSISLTGATIASNQALTRFEVTPPGSSSGGGIANAGAGLFINTTLIGNNSQDSGNASHGNDVSGSITSSHSLIGQTEGSAITDDGGNIFNVNPALDPGGLKLNGGPTQTVALEDGSPAIDTGDNAVCSALPPTGLGKVDQRGIARFRHGDNLCDIGAFEFITLLVRPTCKWFGFEPVGQQTRSQQVSVTNNQATSVTLSKSIGGTNPGAFRIVSTSCGASLAPNTSCAIAIAFKPGAAGKRLALLTVSDNPDRTSPYQVALIGVGT
jgi:hypothetical protein